MNLQTRTLSELTPWDKNPRSISRDEFLRLKVLIQKLGLFKPFIITEDGTILGGNMRYRAVQELEFTEVPVSVVNAPTDKEKLEYALADNDRAGSYDEQALAELISSLDDFPLEDYKVDLGPLTSLPKMLSKFADIESEMNPLDETIERCPECGKVLSKQ